MAKAAIASPEEVERLKGIVAMEEANPGSTEPSDADLFEDLDSEPVPLAPRPDDGIDLGADLTDDEKTEFAKLLDRFMPIRERARYLAKLAKFTDTKRAAVGLRAIQEINALCGVSGDHPTNAPPMFVLPPGTAVAVVTGKVKK